MRDVKQHILRTPALRHSLLAQSRVISALMLRDIKTRIGSSYFGFLIGLILPLGHIAAVTAAYVIVGRRAPIGTDVVVYLTSAILPFIIWSYTHQKMISSFSQNMILTAFPVVTLFDIIAARALVELLSSVFVVAFVLASLVIYGGDVFINNMPLLFLSLILAYLLGVGTGMLFGILGRMLTAFNIIGFIIIPIFWITSGVLFIPDALPQFIRDCVGMFALSHIVDLARTAIFPSYISTYPSATYVILAIIGNVLVSLGAIRVFRPYLAA